jgi:hypothetical protein
LGIHHSPAVVARLIGAAIAQATREQSQNEYFMRVDAANGAHDLRRAAIIAGSCVAALVLSAAAAAHGIEGKDAAFVAGNSGPQVVPFLYLGAKHMVTGYDHLLFILGVVFFLYRLTHVAIYVTLFSIGHSITLLTGVFNHIDVNPISSMR